MRLGRTMRMDGIALKMGVCLSVASFAHLAMTDILKGMGVSGGRLLLCLSDSHEIKDFGSLLILIRSFSAARKRMNNRGCREPSLHSDRAERKRIDADVNGTFTEPRIPGTLPCILQKKANGACRFMRQPRLLFAVVYVLHAIAICLI